MIQRCPICKLPTGLTYGLLYEGHPLRPLESVPGRVCCGDGPAMTLDDKRALVSLLNVNTLPRSWGNA